MRNQGLVLAPIKHPQPQANSHDKEQEARIRPVARGIPPLGLVRLVDPHAGDLPQASADAHVDGDGEARGRGADDVGRQPAQHRRDAGKGARGGEDEASVASLVGRCRESGRGDEADGADEGSSRSVIASGVEAVC